jgi:hypothetical protein
MPVSSAIQQKNFKLTIDDGLPQATVENIGGIHWLKCCPLCGCTHEILGVNEGLPYTPLCQRLPLMFKTQQVIWHKLYPDVTQYTTLHLILGKSH